MKIFSFLLLLFILTKNFSQNLDSKIDFEIYSDFFINGSVENESNHKISDYLYSYNRTNEFSLNLGYIKAKYSDSNFRTNLAMMAGTYGIDNYAGEDGLFKNLFEANVGFKLSRRINHWIDIGVMPSHIGFESAVGYDCWNVSRSLLAENSPYFETGIKYTHVTQNDKWMSSIMILNGWQKIVMDDGYTIPALGMQFQYKPTPKLVMNYSNFIGSVKPDSIAQLRVYQNFFLTYLLSNKIQTVINFDIGRESLPSGAIAYWYGAFGGIRYTFSEKNSLAFRAEFLEDRDNVLYPEMNSDWFTWSSSINFDRRINSFALLRLELKYMNSNNLIFLSNQREHFGGFLALQVNI